jgi:hypothetical protein
MAETMVVKTKAKRTNHKICFKILGVLESFLIN